MSDLCYANWESRTMDSVRDWAEFNRRAKKYREKKINKYIGEITATLNVGKISDETCEKLRRLLFRIRKAEFELGI